MGTTLNSFRKQTADSFSGLCRNSVKRFRWPHWGLPVVFLVCLSGWLTTPASRAAAGTTASAQPFMTAEIGRAHV